LEEIASQNKETDAHRCHYVYNNTNALQWLTVQGITAAAGTKFNRN